MSVRNTLLGGTNFTTEFLASSDLNDTFDAAAESNIKYLVSGSGGSTTAGWQTLASFSTSDALPFDAIIVVEIYADAHGGDTVQLALDNAGGTSTPTGGTLTSASAAGAVQTVHIELVRGNAFSAPDRSSWYMRTVETTTVTHTANLADAYFATNAAEDFYIKINHSSTDSCPYAYRAWVIMNKAFNF